MVLNEWRLLEPISAGLQERSNDGGAAIQEFWKRVDVDSHNLNVAYLGLYALTHQLQGVFDPQDAELHIFGDLHHDDAKKSSHITPEDYFEPDMTRDRVMEVFGDHAISTAKSLLTAFPLVDSKVITQVYWHHPYSQNYEVSYGDSLVDLSDPANSTTKHMVELLIVCDRVSAGVELRHRKTESKTAEEIAAIIESEFAAYPPEFGLSCEWIDIDQLIHEAVQVQQKPFSWGTIAHEMEVFGNQTGKSLEPLIDEFHRMDELVSWTLANYLQTFGQHDL